MARRAVFVDTGAWIGVVTKTDKNHSAANALLADLLQRRSRLVTSEYVLVETYTFLLARLGYNATCSFHERLEQFRAKHFLSVVLITPDLFEATWSTFERFNRDHHWSFTDCSSKVVMEELGLTDAFAFDRHFEQMGLTRIP